MPRGAMTTSDLHLFVNPSAGRGRAGKRLPRILELLRADGLDPEVHESQGVGDLERAVRAAVERGATRLIVAGGDGSVHEAANGMLSADSVAALGVVPTGTGNDFAKAVDIPLDWETATRLLADRIASAAPVRHVDAATMNDRYFVNGAGIGLDAKVTRIARSFRLPIGDLVYLLAILRTLTEGILTPDLVVESEGFEYRGPLTLASVSNGAWIGGMFHIAPMADNRDGRLELLLVAPVTRHRILALLPKLIRGRHISEPEITHTSVEHVTITADDDIPSHLDGEVQPLARRFDIAILPAALRLL